MLVDAGLLALLAEIVVGANRAHVAHTRDRLNVAAIARGFGENGVLLLLLSLDDVVSEHLLELSAAVLLHFISDNLDDLKDLLGRDDSGAVALAARQTLPVHLGPKALEARD